MRLSKSGNILKATLLIFVLFSYKPASAQVKFANPERIRYDGSCMTIDGKDLFIYSAAFYYFRCPEELWKERFHQIKEAGFNMVETYVPWNWHERKDPVDPRKIEPSGGSHVQY